MYGIERTVVDKESAMNSAMRFAFFDVDGTLISVKSMFSFQEYYYSQWQRTVENDKFWSRNWDDFIQDMENLSELHAPREEINQRYYEYFEGRRPSDVRACAEAWFLDRRTSGGDFYVSAMTKQLHLQRRRGLVPAFVSGSLPEILAPLSRELMVSHIIATNLEVSSQGFYTGAIIQPQTIGLGKAKAIGRFLAQRSADPAACHAYGDDISDVPMLDAVGHPHAVIGDPSLATHARERGWDIIELPGHKAQPLLSAQL